MEALLIGPSENILWPLPGLLARADFYIDVISHAKILEKSRFIRSFFKISSDESFLKQAIHLLDKKSYDWIIITDESYLLEILSADIPDHLKNKLLPVLSPDYFPHLGSKIGLAEILSNANILTPKYRIVRNFKETTEAADTLGYPFLLKVDASSGGAGVYTCTNEHDIHQLQNLFDQEHALLAQEKISGKELDLSALFFEGKLIHFHYDFFVKTCGHYGPSFLRDYYPLESIEQEVFFELQRLGKSLGAHGFANITCIETIDKKRYYFEADMRPNVWVDFTYFINDDVAKRIKLWFKTKETLAINEIIIHPLLYKPTSIPYFLRLSTLDLILNRYRVWKFIPYHDKKLVHALLIRKILPSIYMTLKLNKLLPKKCKHFLKKLLLH